MLSNLVGILNQHHVVELAKTNVVYEAIFMSLGNCYQHFRELACHSLNAIDKNQLIPQYKEMCVDLIDACLLVILRVLLKYHSSNTSFYCWRTVIKNNHIATKCKPNFVFTNQ